MKLVRLKGNLVTYNIFRGYEEEVGCHYEQIFSEEEVSEKKKELENFKGDHGECYKNIQVQELTEAEIEKEIDYVRHTIRNAEIEVKNAQQKINENEQLLSLLEKASH